MRIKRIRQSGSAVLVEWHEGGTCRAIVPADAIQGDYVSDQDLAMAVPYGVGWEEILEQLLPDRQSTIESIALTLRNRGVWTADDARSNINTIVGALQTGYGTTASSIIRTLKQQEE